MHQRRPRRQMAEMAATGSNRHRRCAFASAGDFAALQQDLRKLNLGAQRAAFIAARAMIHDNVAQLARCQAEFATTREQVNRFTFQFGAHRNRVDLRAARRGGDEYIGGFTDSTFEDQATCATGIDADAQFHGREIAGPEFDDRACSR